MQPSTTQEPFLNIGWVDLLIGYWPVLLVSFVVSCIATPICRTIAHKTGVVDRPNEARKIHTKTTAYLGGVAVLIAIFAGICVSYTSLIQSNNKHTHTGTSRNETTPTRQRRFTIKVLRIRCGSHC